MAFLRQLLMPCSPYIVRQHLFPHLMLIWLCIRFNEQNNFSSQWDSLFALPLFQQHLWDYVNIWFGWGLLLDCCWLELQGVIRWPEQWGICCLILSQSHKSHRKEKPGIETLLQLALSTTPWLWTDQDSLSYVLSLIFKHLSVAGKMS